MKKYLNLKSTVMLLLLMTIAMESFGQVTKLQTATSKERKEYLQKNYGLTNPQVKSYENALLMLEKRENELKNQVMNSAQYKKAVQANNKEFCNKVSLIIGPKLYGEWRHCARSLGGYRRLADDLLVPREKIVQLLESEKIWWEERATMWESGIEESLKHKKDAEMLINLRQKNVTILGSTVGEYYNVGKEIYLAAFTAMDKYSVAYNVALKIASIEYQFKVERQEIVTRKWADYSDAEELLVKKEIEIRKKVKAEVSQDIYTKWIRMRDCGMDYEMQNKYKLTKVQISSYKELFNKYAIQEFKILNERTSASERLTNMTEANEQFCNSVKSLFSAPLYKKWLGRRNFEFEQKLKSKKIKN